MDAASGRAGDAKRTAASGACRPADRRRPCAIVFWTSGSAASVGGCGPQGGQAAAGFVHGGLASGAGVAMAFHLGGAGGVEQAVDVVVREVGDVAAGRELGGDVIVGLRHGVSPMTRTLADGLSASEGFAASLAYAGLVSTRACQFMFQLFAQGGEAVVHVRAHRGFGAIDDLGDAGVGQPLPDAQRDDGALLFREAGDGAADEVGGLGGDEGVGRRGAVGRGAVFGQRRRPRRPQSEGGAALVHGDGVQPRLERPRVLVLPTFHPDGQEHFLKQLLAAVAVAGHAHQERQQRRGVAAHQQFQAGAVAVRRAGHERLVGFADRRHVSLRSCTPTYAAATARRGSEKMAGRPCIPSGVCHSTR